jgi:hypothetical protein
MLVHDEFDGENVFLEQKLRRFFLSAEVTTLLWQYIFFLTSIFFRERTFCIKRRGERDPRKQQELQRAAIAGNCFATENRRKARNYKRGTAHNRLRVQAGRVAAVLPASAYAANVFAVSSGGPHASANVLRSLRQPARPACCRLPCP